jgi:hypothetical protein
LKLDHRPDLRRYVGLDGVHERIGHRLDGFTFPNVSPTPSQAGDGAEAVMD